MFIRICVPIFIFLSLSFNAWSAQTGRDIMLIVDAVDNSKDAMMSSTMVIERGSQKLVRRMEQFTKKFGTDLKDEKTLIRFLEPADVRGTSYLTWSYDDSTVDDDMWVYLPAESLVRRISGGGKKGAFMRSDLANEDLEVRAVDDDTHTLLGEQNVHGADCFIIESVPKQELKKETNYSKRILFIRKDIYLPSVIEYYDKRGKLLKKATYGGFQEIDGIWSITRFKFETPRRKTQTLIQRSDIYYNQGLESSLFQQSNLIR